jgi:hypothetical protein
MEGLQKQKSDLTSMIQQQQLAKIRAAQLAGNLEEAEMLGASLDHMVKSLETKYQRSLEVLSQSYDEYMKKMAPAPEFLPVRVKVIFPGK